MKKRKIVFGSIFTVLLMLMTICYFVGARNIYLEEDNSFCVTTDMNENDADLPIWNVGDSWTYHVETEGEQNEYFAMDFDLDINNLEFEVIEVQNDMYILSMIVPQGDFNGEASIDLGGFTFSGSLEDAYMNGFLYVKKSTLEIIKFEGAIEGDTNKIILPHFNIGFQLEFEIEENYQAVKTNFSSLRFPMNIDDIWIIPLTYLNMTFNAYQPNLGQNRLYSYVSEHEVESM